MIVICPYLPVIPKPQDKQCQKDVTIDGHGTKPSEGQGTKKKWLPPVFENVTFSLSFVLYFKNYFSQHGFSDSKGSIYVLENIIIHISSIRGDYY